MFDVDPYTDIGHHQIGEFFGAVKRGVRRKSIGPEHGDGTRSATCDNPCADGSTGQPQRQRATGLHMAYVGFWFHSSPTPNLADLLQIKKPERTIFSEFCGLPDIA